MSPTTVTATLPPTNNHLDAEQRTRLLRSTRKLEALLGATPLIVDPESASDGQKTPKPKSRNARKAFNETSSSSSVESEYIVVDPHGRSAPYTYQTISNYSTPSSSRSSSPMPDIKKQMPSLSKPTPVAIAIDLPTGKKGKGLQPIAQPLLLRLRSVPSTNVDSASLISPTVSTFSMDVSVVEAKPPAMSDKERRKKMAKLVRTLGENIPPELVFGGTSTAPSAFTAGKVINPPKRRSSISYAAEMVSASAGGGHKSSKSLAANATTTRSGSTMPGPSPPPKDVVITTTPSSTPSKRRHRPRSLTLGSGSALAASATTKQPEVGKRSLDAQTYRRPLPTPPQQKNHHGKEPKQSQRRTSYLDFELDDEATPRAASFSQSRSRSTTPPQHQPIPITLTLPLEDMDPVAFRAAQIGLGLGVGSSKASIISARSRPFANLYKPESESEGGEKKAVWAVREVVEGGKRSLEAGGGRPSVDSRGRRSEESSWTDGLTVEFGKRKEREWSGEWNVQDMEVVADRLRKL